MNTMNMPGFTAEAALFQMRGNYPMILIDESLRSRADTRGVFIFALPMASS
jgi:hypothetical protein